MKRCVIIGGAPINNYNFIKNHLSESDFYIFCDSGLKHENSLEVSADLIIGDFDSHENPNRETETIVLPSEKDDTDTVFAIKEAIKRGFSEFLLIGVLGKRIDHTLGNVYALLMLHNANKKALIVDDFSELEIVAQQPIKINDDCEFFSIINISGTAEQITVKNAKYNLFSAEIKSDYQYGISNEVIKGKTAEISIGNGVALLVKVFDEKDYL